MIQKLVDDFKRSNKERKLKIANKYGYATTEAYLAYLMKLLTVEIQEKANEKITPLEEQLTDIVIAFDTTGSMASYIKDVKKHVIALIPNLFKNTKNLKLSIVAFGDYCDMKRPNEFGKAYQVIDLSDNENDLISFVSNAQDTNGGDSDEFYELVLQKIRLETSWREGSNKSILLIADYNPHPLGYSYSDRNGFYVNDNKIDWRQEAKELSNLNIKVDTLAIIPSHKWYSELSEITNGIYLVFKSSEKTANMMEGYTYARSGATESFGKTFTMAMSSGDEELKVLYKQLNTIK